MKKDLFTTIFIFLGMVSFSQTPKADSLKQILANERELLTQFTLNSEIAEELIEKGHPDKVPPYINQLYTIAAKVKSDSLLILSYRITARHLDYKTDSKEEIEYLLKALALAEKKYQSILPSIYDYMGSAYSDLHNYEEALVYLQKARSLQEQGYAPQRLLANICYQLANAFYYLGKPDSTLHYAQLANELYMKYSSHEHQKILWSLTADAYTQLGNSKLAESFYHNSIDEDASSKSYSDARAAGAYSNFLLSQDRLQQAKYYGIKGLNAALAAQAKAPLLDNVATLRKIYEASQQPDSAYYFAKLELAYRDSLFNQERLYAVQDMTFKEQVRQQEEVIKKADEDLQHMHNLQYAAIALAIVTFVILFFLFSHSVIANQKLIRFLGVVALLVMFEFINLFVHPFVAHTSKDAPLLMLLVMVCIAALLVPIHHRLEHWITHKLVEKNNRIRLAAAERTIKKLKGVIGSVQEEKSTNAQQ